VIFKYSEEDFDRMFGLKKSKKAEEKDEVSEDAKETVAVEETVSEE
jgi:hypothetical protein